MGHISARKNMDLNLGFNINVNILWPIFKISSRKKKERVHNIQHMFHVTNKHFQFLIKNTKALRPTKLSGIVIDARSWWKSQYVEMM